MKVLFLGFDGDSWDKFVVGGLILAAFTAFIVVLATWGASRVHKLEAQAFELALAKADTNLLHEQRLTANERWRLKRLEHAVLPRSNFVNWGQLVADLKAGQFASVNLAIPRVPAEASDFGFHIADALRQAGLLKKLVELPPSTSEFVPVSSGGATLFTVDAHGTALSTMLWQKYRIGGGAGPFLPGSMPPEWGIIPRDENCLVILENNAALGPGDGQDGEGIDADGRPDPAP